MIQSAPRIFVAGGVTVDTIIYLDDFPEPRPQTLFSKDSQETIGGTGAGKALNLNKLDFDVRFHAMLGNDAAGQGVRAAFRREGLRFLSDIDPVGTERHVNLMNAAGERISIYAKSATFEPDVDLLRLGGDIGEWDVAVINIINYCRYLLPLAQAHGTPIWVDLHDYDGKSSYHQDFVDAADVLFLSSDALPNYEAFMRRMIEAGKHLVVCTHGRDGASGLDQDGNWIEIPALVKHFPIKDTNGAGDAFFSGVLYGYLRGEPLIKCLQYGTIVAGYCITSSELVYGDLSVDVVEAKYQAVYG